MRALLNWISSIRATETRSSSAKNVLVVKRVWIEKPLCGSFTLCETEAEGLIDRTDDNEASEVKVDRLKKTQPELRLLLSAADGCPLSAFYLETADGRVLAVHDDEVQIAVTLGKYRWA